MTFEQFAYWLQGFAEISGREPSAAEWVMIKDHLATCFKKETLSNEEIDKWFKSYSKEWNKNGILPGTVYPFDKPTIVC